MTTDRISRRRLVAGAGACGALGALGAAGGRYIDGGASIAPRDEPAAPPDGARRVQFHGTHQQGITTPLQRHLHFAAFDLTVANRTTMVGLLKDWTVAARCLTAGRPLGRGSLGSLAPPPDTGEAVDLGASRLTVTVGLGPRLFDDRLGLAGMRPPALADLPSFPGDALEAARCGGDLALQVCADDPQVAVHAVRSLTRVAMGRAAIRWAQLGYAATSTTHRPSPTPRNLFGFKDGTLNIVGDDDAALTEHVWAHRSDGCGWMAGGSYLVARRIRMTLETWDRTSLADQQAAVGRTKDVGAPLGAAREHDDVHLEDLPPESHVRLAHPSRHRGARLLRRGFSFVDGADELGRLDAGLFFLAYQRDPRTAFVPIQTELARSDAMATYLRHTGSSVWAVLPGVGSDGWWGETLLT